MSNPVVIPEQSELFSIEAFLRRWGDYTALLAIDSVLINSEIAYTEKFSEIEIIVEEAMKKNER